MPELPEVETFRLYLEATSLDQRIAGVEVLRSKILHTDWETLRDTLRGNRFTGTHRIGKHLLIRLERGPLLVLHFGMTGNLVYYRDQEEQPPHTRAVFAFQNGFRLAFTDQRIFGKIGLTPDLDTYVKEKKLGPDALDITAAGLQQALRSRKSALKPVLLNQQVLAGIGNWIVDEVLYQAQLHPERPAHLLTPAETERLHAAIQEVLQTAIRHEAVYRHFPQQYLIHAREWDEAPVPGSRQHLQCSRCQTTVAKTVVGGRATYYCPVCQTA